MSYKTIAVRVESFQGSHCKVRDESKMAIKLFYHNFNLLKS